MMLANYNTRRSSVVLNPNGRVLRGLGALGFDDYGEDIGSVYNNTYDYAFASEAEQAAINDAITEQQNAAEAERVVAIDAEIADQKALDAANEAEAARVAAINEELALEAANKAEEARVAAINAEIAKQNELDAKAKKAASDSRVSQGQAAQAASKAQTAKTPQQAQGQQQTASNAAIAAVAAAAVAAALAQKANTPTATAAAQAAQASAAAAQASAAAAKLGMSPAYMRFLPQNGGLGIPALYKEIRDFVSTHSDAEIQTAMQASGVSSADIKAAFQEVGLQPPASTQAGSSSGLVLIFAAAAGFLLMGN